MRLAALALLLACTCNSGAAPSSGSAPPAASPASPFWSCSALDRGVALSYDDGPGPYTEALLDALRDAQAPAAFFVLSGLAVARPDTVRRALAEGHTLGLHTATHANLTALWEAGDADGLRREIDDAADTLQALTGQRPRYFRPPYGAITPGLRDYLHERGFAIALWSSGCVDWALRDAAKELPLLIDGLADAGALVCMHDIWQSTVEGAPALIRALRSGAEGGWPNPQGRQVVSLDHCTGRKKQQEAAGTAVQ